MAPEMISSDDEFEVIPTSPMRRLEKRIEKMEGGSYSSEVSRLIEAAFAKTILEKKVTYDLERLMTGATRLKTSEMADAIVANM